MLTISLETSLRIFHFKYEYCISVHSTDIYISLFIVYFLPYLRAGMNREPLIHSGTFLNSVGVVALGAGNLNEIILE